jgi:hypothetical protein
MEWVPEDMWFTYLQLEADAGDLDYDLAISADQDTLPAIADAGIEASEARPVRLPDPGTETWPLLLGGAVGIGTLLVLGRRNRRLGPAMPA